MVAATTYDGSTGVAKDYFPITPHDVNNFTTPVRAIRANTAGVAQLVKADGAVVAMNFSAGETRGLFCIRINSTGTTAGGLEGMV